jgi:hypothetical protein
MNFNKPAMAAAVATSQLVHPDLSGVTMRGCMFAEFEMVVDESGRPIRRPIH